MTIHYHGTPITPNRTLEKLAGRHFCISFYRPDQVKQAHRLGQSCMLDNGAFSAWRKGVEIAWEEFYEWAEIWLIFLTTWAVIPDVIDGTEQDNDRLMMAWPFAHRGAPVWHVHESYDRLRKLCDEWPKVCLGSSGQYAVIGTDAWHNRMYQTINMLYREGRNGTWLHMLRGLALVDSEYPFNSVDSTNIGRNHKRNGCALAMANRWDAIQCPSTWILPPWE